MLARNSDPASDHAFDLSDRDAVYRAVRALHTAASDLAAAHAPSPVAPRKDRS